VTRYHNILTSFWVGLSLFVIILSYKLGLGSFHNPGPGFMPFLLGLLLFPFSFFLFIKSLSRNIGGDETLEEKRGRVDIGKLCLVLATLFSYAFLLEIIGFVIVTFLSLSLLFWGMGVGRWKSVAASAVTTIIAYFFFTCLGVRFPPGVLKALLR
jgi:putative tricarboxylic transport membrane protein